MASTIEVMRDVPVILVRQEPGGSVVKDMGEVLSRINDAIATQTERAFLVLDLTNVRLRLDEVSMLMAKMARGDSSLLRHPNLCETVVATTSPVTITALGIVDGPLFDGVRLHTVDTCNAALAYCRDKHGRPPG